MNKDKKNINKSEHVAILAGAGTGKTTSIIKDITRGIDNGVVEAENILALTFSKRAVVDLKKRLMEQVSGDVTVKTFHAISYDILLKRRKSIGLSDNIKILNQNEAKSFLKGILEEESKSGGVRGIKKVWSVIEGYKCSGLLPEMMKGKKGYDHSIIALYEKLQNELLSNNILTFSDIILYAINILKDNPKLLKKYQSKYKFIYVDEFQDTNFAQYKLMELLAGRKGRLFVVGDDDQSIYSWRYVHPRILERFKEDYGISGYKKLEKNYRSSGAIIHVANKLISNNKNRIGKKLIPTKPSGKLVKLKRLVKQEEEAKWIADKISRITKDKDHQNKTFAILCRHKELFKKIEIQLSRAKIAHSTINKAFQSSKDFLDEIGNGQEKENPEDKGNVTLMTIHASKGLEFDFVFLPGWEEHRFPGKSSKLEEERRVAFVAITRAKERLFISSVLVNRDGSKRKSKEISVSRFANELDKNYVERRRSKTSSKWLENEKKYVEPSDEIEVDDIVSYNAYYKKINYGFGKVTGVLGKKIEVEFNGYDVGVVKISDVTKVLRPSRRNKAYLLYNEKLEK